MTKPLIIAVVAVSAACSLASAQPAVRVEPVKLKGPRALEEQTAAAVVRNYLDSWQTMRSALQQNRADLLDRAFVGAAKQTLARSIQEQAALGIRTNYVDREHDIQIVFYSPEGLSVELIDRVSYDVQVIDHDKSVTEQRVQARYVVVLTPAEVRWRVRVFQAQPD